MKQDGPINKDLTNLVLGKQYKLLKKLGSGAFGEIYSAINLNKEQFAIKLERKDCQFPQVYFEAKLYNYLQSDNSSECVLPKIYGVNTENEYNYMIMDLLGNSLEDLFYEQNNKFSLKTVLMLADQMISRIEFIHNRQFIHRDVKPDNFLMGIGKQSSKLFIVDLGLAKRYMTKEGHIPYKENKSLTGTIRYASINTHLGIESSRRDDLESLGYVLVYLSKGTLPWMNIKINNQKEKYQKIQEKKMSTKPEQLCSGQPHEFIQYMNYCLALKFEQKPDYNYLRDLFKQAAKKLDVQFDFRFDWTKQENGKTKEKEKPHIQEIQNNIVNNKEKQKPLLNKAVSLIKIDQKKIDEQQKQQQNQKKLNIQTNKEKKDINLPTHQKQNKSVKDIKINNSKPIIKNTIPITKNRPQSAKQPIQVQQLKQQSIQPPRIVINKEPYQKF